MITMGVPQNLGRKTFMLFLSRKTTTALVLFVASVVILAIQSSLAYGIAGVMAIGGSVSVATASNISGAIGYINLIIFLAAVIAFLLGLIISMLQYRNYTFTLDEFDIKMRRGVFNKKEISIAYRQIQAVDIMRSLPYRLFGVSRLVMITAGHDEPGKGEEADTLLDPIDKDTAEGIRELLERKIGVQVTEGTVQADKEEKAEEKIA